MRKIASSPGEPELPLGMRLGDYWRYLYLPWLVRRSSLPHRKLPLSEATEPLRGRSIYKDKAWVYRKDVSAYSQMLESKHESKLK